MIALALVFFSARYAGPLYQTLALLVFAYVVRFFPQALAGVGSALQTVSPRLEEPREDSAAAPGARSRRSPSRSCLRHRRGRALVFLSGMKELPATLLLRPIGFDTLATEIWKFTQLGAYSRAAPAALLLIVVSAPFIYCWRRDGNRISERPGSWIRLESMAHGHSVDEYLETIYFLAFPIGNITRARRARRRSQPVSPRCSGSRALQRERC